MSDEEWVSDTDTVEGDAFNRANFQKVTAKGDHETVEVVRGAPKPGIMGSSYKFSSSEPTPAPSYAPAPTPAPVQTYQPPPQPTYQSPPQPTYQPPPKPAPTFEANSLENQHQQEAIERQQAQAIQGSKFKGIADQEIIDFFNEMNKKTFTEQAVEYLNAYWDEIGDQAEFIFSVAHRIFIEADMHRQGIQLHFQYNEGNDVDYPTYLYFYEKLAKFVKQNPQWRTGQYEKSAVYEVKTAIKHKKELQEKVDVNFDGRISFLEFLLYQYNAISNPAQFMNRARAAGDEHPAIQAARLALEEVNERIRAYEKERRRLEEGCKLPGVKGLSFKHLLAVLDSSPLAEELNKALITAEAAVRIAVRKFAGQMGSATGKDGFTPRGALWWMQRDLEEKKKYKRQAP